VATVAEQDGHEAGADVNVSTMLRAALRELGR
jgi:hypothetical protein